MTLSRSSLYEAAQEYLDAVSELAFEDSGGAGGNDQDAFTRLDKADDALRAALVEAPAQEREGYLPAIADYDLRVIRERVEAATPGPWAYGGMIGDPGELLAHFVRNAKGDIASYSERFAADYAGLDKDQRFIAAARSDVPRLLDEIASLQRALRDTPSLPSPVAASPVSPRLSPEDIRDCMSWMSLSQSEAHTIAEHLNARMNTKLSASPSPMGEQ